MRSLALLLVAGCTFHQGLTAGSGDGGVPDVTIDDAPADAPPGDTPPMCTTHALPPALNVDPATWSASFVTAPSWSCSGAGTTTIDSSTGAITGACGNMPPITNDVAQQGGGPNVMVVRLRGLSITNDHVLRLVGDKPIVLLVAGDVLVDTGGVIDAGARADVPGPGGSLASQCPDQAHGLGGNASSGGWGGGGGGFGTAGGQGGFNIVNGGVASGTLAPLRGGCSGGFGNGTAATNQSTGAGGGAFEISASGTITITSGVLSAAGGGAPAFTGGGNGGGSGGGIVLVSPAAATFGAQGAVRAHGGAGSSGSSMGANLAGDDGHLADDTAATDSSGIPGGGNNNDHGRSGGLAYKVGAGAIMTAPGNTTTMQNGGRGGGGGGGGRIQIATGATTMACD